MTLRWITWGDEGAWHLRFGPDGPPLCGVRIPIGGSRSRSLSEGAPAKRCPDCGTVIRFRLGLA